MPCFKHGYMCVLSIRWAEVCQLADKILEAGPAATRIFSAMRVPSSTSGGNPARRLNLLYGLTDTSSKLYYSRVPLRGVKDGKVEMTWMPFNLPHEVLAKLWQQNPADFLHHQHSAQHLPPLLREEGAAKKLFFEVYTDGVGITKRDSFTIWYVGNVFSPPGSRGLCAQMRPLPMRVQRPAHVASHRAGVGIVLRNGSHRYLAFRSLGRHSV